ncbi:unnamed protein product [Allacma fusca]|uniref:60S ribosome subunit biogenesis protein NIP7 homolog n=1 Tax=Allacma fusca TaxID=39272 RepID=A0A8J2KL90_9HEXA|nr:unnamed protein product [Allacma fusca]
MRPLTPEETKIFFEKLAKFIGENIKLLIDRPDGTYCFRLHQERVYYVSEEIMLKAGNIARHNLVCLGTCIGKFTKSKKFHLHITALDYLAPYALGKMWLKSSAEQQFLYGNNVTKSGLGRISDNVNRYDGVVLFSMHDIPLGFGTAAKSTSDCRHVDPSALICFHQGDIGEYIRSENTLT